MHQYRLVGALACGAALLTLLLTPHVAQAIVPASVTPGGDATGATPSPSPTATTDPVPTLSPTPSESQSPTPTPSATPTAEPPLTAWQLRLRRIRRLRAIVLRVARRQLGVPYVWGGASRRGFDCSGLTMYVFRRIGMSFSHGATDQARHGRRVSLRHLKPADLVFYGGSGYYRHVAIYIGDGRIIEAPRPGYHVRVAPLRDASAARRYIGG